MADFTSHLWIVFLFHRLSIRNTLGGFEMSTKEKQFYYGKLCNCNEPLESKKVKIGYYRTCCGYSVTQRKKYKLMYENEKTDALRRLS